jgi:outer membrane receptor protein involved in Fe transport
LDPSKNNNIDVNGFYKLEFKEGKGEITADANHSIGKENRAGYYSEKYYIENGSTANKNVLQQRLKNKEDNIITTLQTDYVRIVTPLRARIEAGAKVIMRDQLVNTYSEAYNYGIDEWSADTLANFDYAYQERIYSTYGIFGQQQGKWKYQAGVRVEYAQQIPNLLSTNTKITNDYFNLFPSAHLKYAVTDKKELGISYSRRVNRASAGQMNPFTNYSDPNNLRTGNPYLIPEYINSLDLGFAVEGKKLNFTSSVFYRYTTDVIQRVKLFYPNSISAVTYANIDESQSYGLELILSYKPTKWFKNTLSMNADRIEYIDRSGETNFNNSGYNFSAKYSGSADFWKKTASIQVNGRFNAPRITAQGKILPRAAVDLSAEKRFKDNKWSIGMRLSDVFNTQGFQFEFDQDFIHQRGEYKWLTRRFYVTVSYKFGKLEVSKKGNRQGEGGGGFDF